MEIGDLGGRDVHCVARQEPLPNAVSEMHRRHVGAVVVVESKGTLSCHVGIVTDRDVLRGQLTRRQDLFTLNVEDVMTPDPLCIPRSCGLAEGIRKMREKGVRRAPIVGDEGELVGLISVDDLLPAVAEELSLLAELIGKQARREK